MSYVRNPLVSWLLSHAYGQGGTVAVPSADPVGEASVAPMGEFPPGIGPMLDYLVSRYSAWGSSSTEVDWCFLVGGPGNGKSEALRSLANRLGVVLPPRMKGQPAPRVIPETWPTTACTLSTGLSAAFVNDASIPRPLSPGTAIPQGSLFLDIVDALTHVALGTSTALYVNVNRGILVEEIASLRLVNGGTLPQEQQLSSAIIRWLNSPPEEATTTDGVETVIYPQATTPHYGQFKVDLTSLDTQLVVVVHVVFLDVLSLLEPRPGFNLPAIDFSTAPPTLSPYQTLGKLVSDEVTRDETIAGGLVQSYADQARWAGGGCVDQQTGQLCQAHALCPFAQNAAWLQDNTLRQRFLDTLRAAEIAAGRRLTYRDLLGHVSLGVIGPPRELWLTGTPPCTWVANQHQAVTNSSSKAVVELASLRIYQNIFPTVGFASEKKVAEHKLTRDCVFMAILPLVLPTGEPGRPQPLERAFSDVDPARDTERWNGLRRQVLDAIESLDVQEPSIQLSSWGEISTAAVSELERALDRVVREEIASELPAGTRASIARVRLLRRWRASMLLRHVGLATGQVRFAPALQAWLAEQENALNRGQRLALGDGINNLILPSGGSGKVYLAPYRPRTYCISDVIPKNTLLVSVNVNELDVILVPHGDMLVAEVQVRRRQEAPQTLAVLNIDLAVAREALLHTDQKSDSFTEIGDTAFARIERARASLISRERLLVLLAAYTDDRGTVNQLSANPTGQPPLRVQHVRG